MLYSIPIHSCFDSGIIVSSSADFSQTKKSVLQGPGLDSLLQSRCADERGAVPSSVNGDCILAQGSAGAKFAVV